MQFVKAAPSNPLISLNNLQQLPADLENQCLSLQRTDIINSSFAPKFARAAAEKDLVIHAAKKKKFCKRKIQIIFFLCEELSR